MPQVLQVMLASGLAARASGLAARASGLAAVMILALGSVAGAQPSVPVEAPAPTPAPAPADAEPLPTDPVLARLISESLAVGPEVARSAAVVQAEQHRVAQAGALADPMLQLGIQNDGFTSIEIGTMDTSFVSIMVAQTFPWPGKRALRRASAELGVATARQAVTRAQLTIEAEVRRGYLNLLLVRERLGLLDRLERLWQSSLGLVRVRYETGDGVQSDLLRAQLELGRLKQRRFGLQAEEHAQLQGLNRLRAHPLDEPIATPGTVRELPLLPAQERRFSVERALAESPELAAARLAIARAGRTTALAEKAAYPDLTVSAGIMVRGALPPMWLATVAGPLPIFSARKQRRAAAESRMWAAATTSEATSIEQTLRLRIAERRTAFSALREIVELYRAGLLVQSEATTESTLSQYKVGKVTFSSVLEANAGFISDQEGYLQAIAAAYQILISDAELSLIAPLMPSGGAAPSGMPGAGASPMSSAGGGAAAAAPSAAPTSSSSSGM